MEMVVKDSGVAERYFWASVGFLLGAIGVQLRQHGLRSLWEGDLGIILLLTFTVTIMLSLIKYRFAEARREQERLRAVMLSDLDEKLVEIQVEIDKLRARAKRA